MLEDLTPDTFRPHVGSTFAIEVQGGEPLLLTLESVDVHGAGHALRAEPFTLVFTGPADRTFAQGTLTLQHEVLGEVVVFLAAFEAGRYSAVFN